jgi:hypothetical protein
MDIETIKEYTSFYVDSLKYDNAFYDETYRNRQTDRIANAEKLEQCLNAVNKGNRFDFLNFLHKYGVITDQECADMVYSIWTMQERFYNCGMAKTKMIKFMKMAEKTLVLPEDIAKLPDDSMITIYRGVKENDYKGLSWTIDRNIAEWFAKRFSYNVNKVYLFSGQLKKKDIIAFFDCRNENEVVCDYRKIKDVQCEEIESKLDKAM